MKQLILPFILLGIAASFAVPTRAFAAPSPEFGAPDGPNKDNAALLENATPVDPVVLEPLRPLFSAPSPAQSGDRGWCGPVGLVTLLTLMLLLGTLRLVPVRPTH